MAYIRSGSCRRRARLYLSGSLIRLDLPGSSSRSGPLSIMLSFAHSGPYTQDVVDPLQSKASRYHTLSSSISYWRECSQYLTPFPKGLSTFNIFKGPVLSSSPMSYGFGSSFTSSVYEQQRLYPSPVDAPRNSPPHKVYLSAHPKPPTMVHDRQPRPQQQWNHPRQGYSTHQNSPNDLMIYETSIPPRSDPSTHEASIASATYYSVDPGSPTFSIDDISSTRASSSTETLQSTLLDPPSSTIGSPSGTFYRVSSSTRNLDVYNVASDRPSNPVNQGQRQQTKSGSDDPRSIYTQASAKGTSSSPTPDRRPPALSMPRRSSPDNFSLSSSTSSSPPSTPEPIHEFPVQVQVDNGRFQVAAQEFPSEGVEQYAEYAQSYYPHPKGGQYIHPYESGGYVERSAEPVAPMPFRTRTVSRRSRSMSITVRPSLKVEVPARRCVRWKDDLVCDSPIPRRKGWFNRKG